MANLKCTECGRFVDQPTDHAKSCTLYGVEFAYKSRPDETTTPTPPTPPGRPDDEQNVPAPPQPPNGRPDDPQPVPPSDVPVEPTTDLTYVDVRVVGLDNAVKHLETHGGKGSVHPKHADHPDEARRVRMPGGIIDVGPDDLLVQDDRGGWFRVHRRVVFPSPDVDPTEETT